MSSNIERKLAAIMFTDIAGYTEQMSQDEDKAFALIQKKRELLLPLIKKHEGKLIKEIGDGTLTRYFKADNAIDCASTFQATTDTDLNVRAGIHTGEVIVDKEDVFGDVVNVASRLESIAVPGSVLVSKETIDKLEMSDSLELVSLGMQSLKGVGRLIEVYAIKDESLVVPNPDDYLENKINVHSDDEVPSIAIIPFENKGKEEDVFYAYGISADLISDVSSAGLIRVPSLKRVEEVADLSLDEKAIKLDVRYTAEGTLWKMGDMFQLSVELYDTKDKKVVWSDRWQEKWDNLPTIKMNLSDGLLKALDTTSKVEKKAETTNTKAYELYLKAKHTYDKRTDTNDTEKARGLLRQTIELDDTLITAKVLLGTTYMQMGDYDEAMKIYTPALEQAEKLGDKTGMGAALGNIGIVYKNKGEYDTALEYYDRSLKIKEEIGDKRGMGNTLINIGVVHANKGEYDTALEYYDRSLKIKEEIGDKRGMGQTLGNIGIVYVERGDYDKALEYYDKSLKIKEEMGNKAGMGAALGNIGIVYKNKGEYDKGLEYYDKSLKIQEEMGNKAGMGNTLINIGIVYKNKGEYDTALEYYDRSLKIKEEIGEKRGMGQTLGNIGIVYVERGDYDKALEYYDKSLKIKEEIGDKRGMGNTLINIGVVHANKGEYDTALEYYDRSLKIKEEIGDKRGMGYSLNSIGVVHYNRAEYNKATEHLEKSLNIQKEIGLKELETTTYLYLCYRHLSKEYDKQDIHSLIKDADNIEYELNFRLYQLLDDTSYLETACKQVQETASEMEEDTGKIFLGYPLPTEIVEEWEQTKENE